MPKEWREGLYKKGDKEDPGNYRGRISQHTYMQFGNLEKNFIHAM